MKEEIEIYILNNRIQLEEECWNCEGGKLTSKTHTHPIFFNVYGICEHCEGTGYILTPVGEAIMKLVKRHRKVEI